jgi:transcriptional regulator with XRE-family HTH domain
VITEQEADLLADMGDRLRVERQARHWSQEELASRTGLARQTIVRLEAGSVDIRLRHLAAIAHAFGIPLTGLLDSRWTPPAVQNRLLTPRQVAVLAAVADGVSLAEAGRRVGISRESAAARLSEAYRLLDVAWMDRDERRAAAVRTARQRGLLSSVAPQQPREGPQMVA